MQHMFSTRENRFIRTNARGRPLGLLYLVMVVLRVSYGYGYTRRLCRVAIFQGGIFYHQNTTKRMQRPKNWITGLSHWPMTRPDPTWTKSFTWWPEDPVPTLVAAVEVCSDIISVHFSHTYCIVISSLIFPLYSDTKNIATIWVLSAIVCGNICLYVCLQFLILANVAHHVS